MFSGIVLGQGLLTHIRPFKGGCTIKVRHAGLGRGVRLGDSVAVDGCCLTVVSNLKGSFEFDLLQETLQRTTLGDIQPGSKVNLETSLRLGDTIGGHFVTGHVDIAAQVVKRTKNGRDVLVEFNVPKNFLRWIVPKGSVAVDGVSLTVATVSPRSFGVWLIPHTLKLTTLGWKAVGDCVNLEGDMLAKYVQKAGAKSMRRKMRGELKAI